jgi:elongator complex protein 4
MWIDERATADGSESEGEGLDETKGEGKNGTRIAWRYERMKKFQTTVKKSDGDGGAGRELNLMTPIPADLLDHLEKTGVQRYVPLGAHGSAMASSSKTSAGWGIMVEVLRKLGEVLKDHDDKAAMRIVIHDLGSADWACPNAQVCLSSCSRIQDPLARKRELTVIGGSSVRTLLAGTHLRKIGGYHNHLPIYPLPSSAAWRGRPHHLDAAPRTRPGRPDRTPRVWR